MQRSAVLSRSLLALAMAASLGSGLAACHHSPLHRSWSLRHKEMFAVQGSARPAREVGAHGEEGARAVRNYYDTFDAQDGGAVGKSIGGSGQGQMTAGVVPMH